MRFWKKALAATCLGVIATPVLSVAPAEAGGSARAGLLWAAGSPTAAGDGGAYAYDADLVPAGARVAVLSLTRSGRTSTLLTVRGLQAGHRYGAHLHVNACAPDPAAAGPHYQQVSDPQQPSTDPAYANPTNEVWLDVRTNARGAGVAVARNPWTYRAAAPRSLVLHAEATHTDPGHAGQAGARVACLTLSRA